ncbi:hypothetical protein HK105_206713 [Polyrhizophydium stewartii]|uniref:Uncharacterized protein n=1 Tax=Polyrhizophydium stewartii TaxID=2732419 RepID=A0ABR4N2V6_9FUNG
MSHHLQGAIRASDVDATPSAALQADDLDGQTGTGHLASQPRTSREGKQRTGEQVAKEKWDRAAKVKPAGGGSGSGGSGSGGSGSGGGGSSNGTSEYGALTSLKLQHGKGSRGNIMAASLGLQPETPKTSTMGGPFSGGSAFNDALERRINDRWERAQEVALLRGSSDDLRDIGADGSGSVGGGIRSPKATRVAAAVVNGAVRGSGAEAKRNADEVARTVQSHWDRAAAIEASGAASSAAAGGGGAGDEAGGDDGTGVVRKRSASGRGDGHHVRTAVLDLALGVPVEAERGRHDVEKLADEKWQRAMRATHGTGDAGGGGGSGGGGAGAAGGSSHGHTPTGAPGTPTGAHGHGHGHVRPAIVQAVIGKQ